jgi:hypothetical protein
MIAVVAFGASDAANTFGSYKIDAGKSSYTAASAGSIDKTMTVTRETSNGGVKQITNGRLPDGTPFYASYTSNHDGKSVPVMGNAPFDTIAVKQVNASSVTDERKKAGGRYKATGRTVFSHSGQKMTVTIQGTNADGVEFKQILVFEKQ